jgi:hypothetical protein
MIPMLRRALTPTLVSLVGLGFALPASAWPLRQIADRHLGSPPLVAVDCDVSLRNACYLRMNTCFYRSTRRPAALNGELRACEAGYFDCISRLKCRRGPVW